MIQKLFPLLFFATLLGCSGDKESFVVILADINCQVPRVYQLRVTVTNNNIPDQQFLPKTLGSNPPEMGFPSTFSLILPGSKSGTIDLAFDALDQNHIVVGQATARGEIKQGGRLDLSIQIIKPPAVCGDGVVDGQETCDDGNRISGDGCSSLCQSEFPTPLDDGGIQSSDGGVVLRDAGITGEATPFLFVSVGLQHTCAVKTDSTLWCWGSNEKNQIHLGTPGVRTTPSNVGGTAWNRVSCGQYHTCALRTNNTLACFGFNGSGQLGGVPLSTDSTWVEVPGNDWKAVSAGEYHTCAVKTNGTLWCWGDNHTGQVGPGNMFEPQISPIQVAGTGWKSVSGNHLHTCATKEEGSLWCWGNNSDYQLGSQASFSQEPRQVEGMDWLDVTTGTSSTCALKTDNSLTCWGANYAGQLGNTTIPIDKDSKTATPTPVSGVNWRSESAGRAHVCAVNADGKLLCWGDNKDGQLGPKGATSVPTPTIMGTSAQNWTMVSSGFTHSCAVSTDGSIYCWGENTKGQLGTGGTEARTTPTKVAN